MNVGIRAVAAQFLSGNICFEFSVLCLCICGVSFLTLLKGVIPVPARVKGTKGLRIVNKFSLMRTAAQWNRSGISAGGS